MHLTTEPQNLGRKTDRTEEKIDNSTIIAGDFNISLYIGQLDRLSARKQKLEQHYKLLGLADICRGPHREQTEYTSFAGGTWGIIQEKPCIRP